MKYAITGAAGRISAPLVEKLLTAGHDVTVIGRSSLRLQKLVELGARAAIGTLEDVEFLKKAFASADVVFAMCPSQLSRGTFKIFYERLGKNYAEAVKVNGTRYVVNLSSIGAHLAEGVGPVEGLYRVEQALNQVSNLNVIHLRPSYFYQNFFSSIEMIKNTGLMGANFSFLNKEFPVADIRDIADIAAQKLLNLNFTGHSVRYISSDETGTDEIAVALGKAIGIPGLKWIKFSDDQVLQGMIQAGLPEPIAAEYVEMFSAFDKGKMTEDYRHHRPELGKVRVEDFARSFAEVWYAKSEINYDSN